MYGRHLLLMACDASTAEWYARRGIYQRTLTVSHGEIEVSSLSRAFEAGNLSQPRAVRGQRVFREQILDCDDM